MDRLPHRAATTAALVSLTLSLVACGGGSSAAPAAPPPGPSAQAVDGVTMPTSVSVVTAKNAN